MTSSSRHNNAFAFSPIRAVDGEIDNAHAEENVAPRCVPASAKYLFFRTNMNGVRIGDKSVLFRETFVVSDNEQVSFTVPYGNHQFIPFLIKFNPGAPTQQMRWYTANGVINVEFEKWTNVLGSATEEPAKLGSIPGIGDVFLSIFHQKTGKINRLDFQLLSKA